MTIYEAFSFGYHGWGNHTAKLVKAIDSVEIARGWKPPVFVDIRIRRSVRAKGFQKDKFARRVGKEDRYHWMPALGNRALKEEYKSNVVIDEPIAVLELLSRVIREWKRERRVIFFCSCECPYYCHRHKVANLLLKAARKNGLRLKVSEWPGGTPRAKRIPRFDLSRKQTRSEDADYLLLAEGLSATKLQRALSLPWMSIARVGHEDWRRTIITGPAKYTHRGWALPNLNRGRALPNLDVPRGQSDAALKRFRDDARRKRVTYGYSDGNERRPIRLRSKRQINNRMS